MTQYDLMIVGAGLSGATIARLAAEDGVSVLVIDKREHLAGNVYDEIDSQTGIRISRYGAHLFHTNDTEVWNFVNRFGKWTPWTHKVIAECDNTLVPVPVNIITVNTLLNTHIRDETEMAEWLKTETTKYETPQNSEEIALNRVGPRLYEKLFKNYTVKQWAKEPSELEPSVLERIPVRPNFDERYFSDRYQALPTDGYTSIVKNMLDHPKITVQLNTSWNPEMEKCWSELVFTGPIDVYFKDSGLPILEYRSINFEWSRLKNSGYYQPNSVVNYPSSLIDSTRCVEYKHFLNQKSDWTIIAKETTTDNGEPYYPVPTKTNRDLYTKYSELAKEAKGVHFVGRLASYKYFNMDQAVRNAIDYYNTYMKERSLIINNEIPHIEIEETEQDLEQELLPPTTQTETQSPTPPPPPPSSSPTPPPPSSSPPLPLSDSATVIALE
jgi:UDP-galactopyranose mutase